ncbi:MAG TPA: ankyrin repeat domain-containing protein [Vicinamibacterales bacterium]|jgi:ankyrin repeat protein|nr:ankyrin repeat domain-containing protein [Vicinamibacterales bacterium]
MRARTKRLASLGLILFPLTVGMAAAAAPDSRLVDAVAGRDTALARTLLKEGIDVNTARADGVTALLWAAHWDDRDAVELLLRAGANVNAADDHGVTPLARACENASEAAVTRLLEAGANPNAAQTNGLTPLMTAARTGNLNVVKALLARGANVNAPTVATHETALMWAVGEGHREIVRALVENGADVHPRAQQAFSPLMAAADNGDIETAKILLAAGAQVNEIASDGTHPLPYAIIVGQAAFAQFLLEQGANPNADIDGITALHAAAGPVDPWLRAWNRLHGGRRAKRLKLNERETLVEALLAKGANPNARMTASEMAGLGFIRNGAFDTFTTGSGDLSGATPLWVAAYASNRGEGSQSFVNRTRGADSSGKVIRSLLVAGARPDLTTADGTTPLMAAGGCGRAAHATNVPRAERQPMAEEATKLLVEVGVDVNATNEADFTALHCAAFTGLPELVQYLVDHGADLNARDWRGRTPFRLAEGAKQSFHYQEWPEVAALLQKLGADTTLGIPGTIHERLRGLAATK